MTTLHGKDEKFTTRKRANLKRLVIACCICATHPDDISIETEEVEEFIAVHLVHVEAVDHDDAPLPTGLGSHRLFNIATRRAKPVLNTSTHNLAGSQHQQADETNSGAKVFSDA